jgi:hypothetical protein
VTSTEEGHVVVADPVEGDELILPRVTLGGKARTRRGIDASRALRVQWMDPEKDQE